jgi:hypothetical protein
MDDSIKVQVTTFYNNPSIWQLVWCNFNPCNKIIIIWWTLNSNCWNKCNLMDDVLKVCYPIFYFGNVAPTFNQIF